MSDEATKRRSDEGEAADRAGGGKPVAMVTGAGRGIGRATAVELARREYRLVLIARNERELAETAKYAAQPPPAVLIAPTDVTQPEQVEQAVKRAIDAYGRIDALVNCAGSAPVRSIDEMTVPQWRAVVETNLSAVFYTTKAVWPVFRGQRRGVIVNLSSFSSRDPFAGLGPYGAAKAGVNLLGLAWAREGREIGVRVHTIAPAAVETGMFRQIMAAEQFPTERTLAPAEVARVIVQCIEGDLKHTSGEVIWLQKD